jgi:DNA-binding response OmpR family regulator
LARALRADDLEIHRGHPAQRKDVFAGMKAGTGHYLTKPFLPSDLVRIMERLLEHSGLVGRVLLPAANATRQSRPRMAQLGTIAGDRGTPCVGGLDAQRRTK